MHLFTDNVAVVLVIKSESDIFINNGLFETHFFDTYVSCSLTFVLYTSGNVQLIASRTPETPTSLKILRVLGVSGVLTPGHPILSKFGILGVSGVWESRTMNCTKA